MRDMAQLRLQVGRAPAACTHPAPPALALPGRRVGVPCPFGVPGPVRAPAACLPRSPQLEVSQLEGSLQQPKAQSAMSPYLVPDTQALCHHLPIIRQLASSGRFIVIIPRTGERASRRGQVGCGWDAGLRFPGPCWGPVHTAAVAEPRVPGRGTHRRRGAAGLDPEGLCVCWGELTCWRPHQ